jgi:lipopolysaccharide/colanic/teichoic acid biosynthesis glycosyltransferase
VYRNSIKQLIDFIASFAAIVILLPVIVITAMVLAFSNTGTPFFIQQRPGRHNKIFKLVKFKTMNDRRDNEGNLLPDHLRLTGVGRFIRSSSLDELPQLFNVMKGDMSLIGPRPLLIKYLPLYTQTQARRHEIRPGITGWAQVNGRNAINWEQKFEYDVWYVDHVSFSLDCKILWKTLVNVIRHKGINASENMTMESFKGGNDAEQIVIASPTKEDTAISH